MPSISIDFPYLKQLNGLHFSSFRPQEQLPGGPRPVPGAPQQWWPSLMGKARLDVGAHRLLVRSSQAD